MVVQGAQLCGCKVVEQVCELAPPELAMRSEHLLQWPAVHKQELDSGSGLLVLNFILLVGAGKIAKAGLKSEIKQY